MKKALHIIQWILGLLAVLLLVGLVVIQSPGVQTALGQKFIRDFQEKTDARISFSQISVRPFDAISFQDVLVEDPSPVVEGMDTLAYVRYLTVKFSLKGLLSGNMLYVNRLNLDGGCFNLCTELDSLSPTGSQLALARLFRLGYPSVEPSVPHWGKIAKVGEVRISDFAFRLYDEKQHQALLDSLGTPDPRVIDWSDFTVDIAHLKIRNATVADDLVTGDLQEGTARERRTGFFFEGLQGLKVRVGKGLVNVGTLKGDFPEGTHLDIRNFVMDGPLPDYNDFIEKIRLEGDFQPETRLSMYGLKYFAGDLEDISFRGQIQGRVEGTINDFLLRNIRISDLDNGVVAQVDGSITGIPDLDSTYFDLQVREFSFTPDKLDDFVMAWASEARLDFNSLAPGERFTLRGQGQGLMNRLRVKADVDSRIGSLQANLLLKDMVSLKRPLTIGGTLRTRDLDAGALAGIPELGPVTLRTGLEARLDNKMTVRIDSLHIDRLRALDYDYTAISAVGTYSDDAFDGRIIAADPNLNFLFQGLFNLSKNTRNAAYQFYASLGYADLHALHLDQRPVSKVSLQASANFVRTEGRDLLGDITLDGISLESETGYHELGPLTIRAHANDNVHRIRLQSDYLEGSFLGDRPIGAFVSDLKSLVVDRDLPALVSKRSEAWNGGTYEAALRVGKAQHLLTFIVPGLWVENKTEARLKIDRNGLVTANLTSGRLALYDKYLKDVTLVFDNDDEVLQATLTSPTLSLGGAQLKGNRLSLYADNNHVGLGYTFDNEESAATKAELYLTGDLARKDGVLSVLAQALPSNIYYRGNGWGLSSGDIRIEGGSLKINQLRASHEDELLLVNGGYSPSRSDTLTVRMEKFDIGLVNTLTGGQPSIEGRATGRAMVVSPGKPNPGLLAAIVCDSTYVSRQPMGRLQVASRWDSAESRFIFFLRNSLNGQRNIDLNGYLKPSDRTLHANAQLNRLDIGYAADILNTVFSQFEGDLSGSLSLDGPIGGLKIKSQDLRIENGTLELDYLRVPYSMSGPLELDNEGLHFRQVTLSDGMKGKGTVTGSVLFNPNQLESISLDTRISMKRMHALSLPQGVNPTLYGSVFGNAEVSVRGPLERITVNVDASVTDESNLHIPTGIGSSDSTKELLTFVQVNDDDEMDDYEKMLRLTQQNTKSSNDLKVALKVRANPQLRVFLDMDSNTLNAQGNGTIQLDTDTKDDSFGLKGDYTLTGGNFHFSVMNLVTRDFNIQEGSSIRFNGEVMNTDLDVHGRYVTKANLSTLLSDESSSSRRTVNCGIDITGKLSDPVVDFSIDVPDLSPGTQTEVESLLNTPDKVQKQFVYLLIAGNFLPGEDSGISANGSDVLFSNVSSIMSGQLNNIFQKLNIPLDLGLNYQATQSGSNLFDVALSTQLFNNRVIVNGAVGNKQLIGGATTNTIAGDIDIEIKLNPSGSLRLKVFSHSADQFTYFLDNSQRNGAGISYQREFNSLGQFFRDLFSSRKTRQERAEAAARNQRNVVLQIDTTGKSQTLYEQ